MVDGSTWHEVARALSLTPKTPYADFSKDLTFGQLRDAVYVDDDSPQAPSSEHWLYGYRDEIEVFVLLFTSATSGKTYTVCVASCEPLEAYATFAGMSRDTLLRYFLPEVDYADSICRPFREAARSMGPNVLVGANDTRTLVARDGTFENLRQLQADLDIAVGLARTISQIESFVPTEWSAFADLHSLAYDAEAAQVRGVVHGAAVDLRLVANEVAPHVGSVLTAKFSTGLISADGQMEATSHPSFLKSVFSDNIEIGVSNIDARYTIAGKPESEVRAFLSRPALCASLALPGLGRLLVEENEAMWTFAGCPPRAKELDVVAECIRSITGAPAKPGPYR